MMFMEGRFVGLRVKQAIYLYSPACELMGLKQASSSLATKDVMFQGIQGPPVGNAGAIAELPTPYWAAH